MKKLVFSLIILLLPLPLLTTKHLFLGDEPHYLLTLNSIIRDKDLNLENNYQNALGGKLDAGENFKGKILDHQTVFVEKGKSPVFWYKTSCLKDLIQKRNNLVCLNKQEITFHSVWYSLISAIPIFILSPFLSIETGAQMATILLTVAAAWVLYKVSLLFLPEKYSLYSSIIFIFATPVWYFSNSLYPDIFLTFLMLLTVYLLLKNKYHFLNGILLGLLVCIKISFIFLPLLLIFYQLNNKNTRNIVKMMLGMGIILGLFLISNYYIYSDLLFLPTIGNPFTESGIFNNSLINGLVTILFSPVQGFFFSMPISIFFFISLFMKKPTANVKIITLLPVFFIVIFSFWGRVEGAGTSIIRHLLPIIPYMIILCMLWVSKETSQMKKFLFWGIFCFSIIIQLSAVFFYPFYILGKPPIIWQMLRNLL